MLLISPNYDFKSIIFSQFWLGAFSQNRWKKPCIVALWLAMYKVVMRLKQGAG